MILVGSNSLPLQIVGVSVNKALYGGKVKPPVGFLPWQKLGDSRKCSRRGNRGLGNQSRGNLSADVDRTAACKHALWSAQILL